MNPVASEVLNGTHLRLTLPGDKPGQVLMDSAGLDALIKDLLAKRRTMRPEPDPPEPSILVVDGGRILQLEISTHPEPIFFEMSAKETEDFAYWLMENRMGMDPPIPDADPPPGTKFLPRAARRWWIEAHPKQNRVTFAVQHAGLGWIWMSLNPQACTMMVRQIVNAVKALPQPPPQNPAQKN